MKRIIFAVLTAILVFGLLFCAGTGSRDRESKSSFWFQDGVYEGKGRAFRGDIHVRVNIEDGFIMEIEVLESLEDRFIGALAIEELLELALIYNTVDLDAVSGATESSEGFLAALQDALDKARIFR